MKTILLRLTKHSLLLRILYFLVNGLFILKYVSRTNINPYLSLVLYILIVLFIYVFYEYLFIKNIPQNKIKIRFWVLLILICVAVLTIQFTINPFTLQIDRWSAINNFIRNLFNGEYPYAARTHMGGYSSPFPVWQVFHIPFYLLGNVALGMLFSILLTAILLLRLFKSYQKAFAFFLFLVLSPAFWYEVAVRSDIFYNFLLCFLAIAIIYKEKYTIQNQAFGLGILCGLFLSTRFSVVVPFAIILLPDFFRSDIKQKTVFAFISIFTFVISFLPFVFWNYNTLFFFKYNPFVLQTRQGSMIEIILIACLVIFLSMRWKDDFKKCSTYISLTFIILVILTFLHKMILYKFKVSLFDSAYDISYFNMALPFIIYSLSIESFSQKPN